MKICSVTITSATKQDIILPALESVLPWVDGCLIIEMEDDRIVADKTFEVANKICGEKHHSTRIKIFKDTTTAEMRNIALVIACQMGYDWAVILDTDERLYWYEKSPEIRAQLEQLSPEVGVVEVASDGISGVMYEKGRFFRLPMRGLFKEDIHEEWIHDVGCCSKYFSGIMFKELPKKFKTKEQRTEFFEQRLQGIERQLIKEPNNERWLYYRSILLVAVGKYAQANYELSALNIRSENRIYKTWSLYGLSLISLAKGELDSAKYYAEQGFLVSPENAEFFCVMSSVSMQQGNFIDALVCAKNAALRNWEQEGKNRTGFRDLPSLFEVPYILMEACYAALNDIGNKEWAARRASHALKMRKHVEQM